MLIIPAIDLRGGFCVRLTKGDLNNEKIYSKDPIFIAKMFKAKGAKMIHVVDLDGAFSGNMKNKNLIYQIKKEVDIPIEVGGGIRSIEVIDELISIGVDRVIVGTIAVYHPEIVSEALKKYPEKIIVSLDVYKEQIAIAGWKEKTTINIYDLVEKLKNFGIKEIIYTDIDKDGTLEGLVYSSVERILKKINIKVIISGGIATLEDIKKIKEYEQYGVTGVIVGKAIYEEKISLEEAISIAGES